MSKMRVVVLISGGGTTMERVIKACKNDEIPAKVVHVISSNGSAGGLQKAWTLGVPTKVLKLHADFGGEKQKFGEAILSICREFHADLIAQLGWLALTPQNVIDEFIGMIINQHPGPLDPGRLGFGGVGMHGKTVHEAVIKFSQLINRPFLTEATVHRVTAEYDNGTLLGTRAMLVKPYDMVDTLSERLLPLEHELVVETIARFATNQEVEVKRTKPLIPKLETEFFHKAIKYAISIKHN